MVTRRVGYGLIACLFSACGVTSAGVTTAQGSWAGDVELQRIDCATRMPIVSSPPDPATVIVAIAPTGEAVFQYTLADGLMTRLTCNVLLSQSGGTVSLATPAFCADANADYVSGTGVEAGGTFVLDLQTETMATDGLRCRRFRHTLRRR